MGELYFELGAVAVLLALGYGFGTLAERRHYASIRRREEELFDLIVVTCRRLPDFSERPRAELVLGSVVVSVDYFKRFLAHLRMLFGGRVTSYESLLDRGRREAVLRLQEEARARGATMVFNLRFETASISKGGQGMLGSVEVLAYGTAIIPEGVAPSA